MPEKKKTDCLDLLDLNIPNACYSLCKYPGFFEYQDKESREKYRKQRMERGFDDTEVWGLYGALAKFLLPRLKELRKVHHGYPGSCGMDPAIDGADRWNEILDEIIWMCEETVLDLWDEDLDSVNELVQGPEDIRSGRKLTRDKRKERAAGYLGAYFFHLWD